MRRNDHHFLFQITILSVLALGLTLQVGRLLREARSARLDLAGADAATLSPAFKTFLRHQDAPLSFTYFATSDSRMPAHMRTVGPTVCALLEAIQSYTPNRVDVRILDPNDSGDEGAAFAARKKVSPFRVREIRQDEHHDQGVWSSLVVGRDNHPEALIQKITPADLPHLQNLLLATLMSQTEPPRPVIAISSPPHFHLFSKSLSSFGEVRQIDLSRSEKIPPDADLLFWFEPRNVTQRHVDELHQYIASGRTVILAGSPYTIDYSVSDPPSFRAHPSDSSWETLLAPFGIHPTPDLLMDRADGPIYFGDASGGIHPIQAPFHLRVMPGYYNLNGFLGPARGALNFVASGALTIDPRRVSDAGFEADILATTTENAWVQSLPQESFTQLDLKDNLKVGKQNLMLHLKPADPWSGSVLILASASPFRDGIVNQPNYGHRVFLQTLMRTFTDPVRIVRGRVPRSGPPRIPEQGDLARILWRATAIGGIPVALLIMAAQRLRKNRTLRLRFDGCGPLAARSGAALLILFLAAPLWQTHNLLTWDLTRENLNTLRPFTYRQLAGKNLKADLIIPQRAQLPAEMKHVETTVSTLLDAVGIPFTLRRPNQLTQQDLARLWKRGLRPFNITRVRHDAEIDDAIWSGLILHRPGLSAAIPRLDGHTVMHKEFLLTACVHRLENGQSPHIAVLAEPPRLSPAEAFEYQQKGLSPPKGADVFSELKNLLRDYGYRVTYIDPRNPDLPEDVDLVVWMQPRRDASDAVRAVSGYLAHGGNVIVALQHYNIQQRQYRGSGFETVYWPQPQYQDLNPYLEPLGLSQPREILMDRTRGHLNLETQIYRRAARESEFQEVALPFLIRAVSANFSSDSPITRHLGDQLFIWGNRFAIQRDSLSAHGLRAQTLIATSPFAWAYDWQGGWLTPDVFTPHSEIGPEPLAILVHGTFPQAAFRKQPDGAVAVNLQHPAQNLPGQLLLIGSSEMFKNDHLYSPGYQHDQFLLNAVADLTLGPAYAELQARRPQPRGFPYIPLNQKRLWRIVVLAVGPAAFLIFGLYRWMQNRRTPSSARRAA